MEDVLIRYIHFLGIIGVGATLSAEHMLIKAEMTVQEIRRLALIDALYGLSAGLVLLAGLALWFVVGDADYYLGNWIFHLKLAVFVTVGVLSLWPTFFFLRARRQAEGTVYVPSLMLMLIRAELALFLLIPLLAVLMARGYGVIG
ncbi:DUF2214 family protein [Emcibacter nanhaiensis]|uniref:DUF2214 family protein n=1 Tax=Emcibacter nanhaiensis TaxID=1505037 RepID=A0A501PNV5_9PROT|nr:DUF2214 family protein [Emcibacter nanhaiensis]TPD61792.1 DUF2214 family protein [Emcibacter nanhaiensis]